MTPLQIVTDLVEACLKDSLDAYVKEKQLEVLVRAKVRCRFEEVNFGVTKHPEDKAYNQAVNDCIETISKLAEELK